MDFDLLDSHYDTQYQMNGAYISQRLDYPVIIYFVISPIDKDITLSPLLK
ncbi:hypothetical protein APHDU1_1492 [Anaplasma phagocytophilum]|uniref:Uncharacterized protein n=1 Tax=Anaplasma phagocytophilum str. NCH-1 TaxID=1359161 RepID=A0A0F3N646_ANAPH|nr:hypothetical protein EPHNCH_0992 [Anaplasma phagocytophilum str. NCH-1]KJZ98028.1 hypothetical protein APHDU1_1492 [Anaplasma phagocytophilum]